MLALKKRGGGGVKYNTSVRKLAIICNDSLISQLEAFEILLEEML